jgi:hypothetical protein
MAYFKILSWHSSGGTEETHKKVRKFKCAGQDPNQAPPEYKSEVLLLQLTCSVFTDTHIKFYGFALPLPSDDWLPPYRPKSFFFFKY